MFKLPAKPILYLIGFVIAILLMAWLVNTIVSGRNAKVEARLGRNQTEAATKSGEDAVNTVGDQITAEDRVDAITRENERDIRNAPGADEAVSSELNDAALRSLCRRAAYRGREECLQFTAP